MTDPTTALREVLELSNKERDAEENREYGAANDLYAELEGAAVNLVRDHGPALLSALEDARRYRAMRASLLAQDDLWMETLISYPAPNNEAEFDSAVDAATDAAIAEGDQE